MVQIPTIPGYVLNQGEKLTRAIINLIGKPTVDSAQLNFLPNLIYNPQFEIVQRGTVTSPPFTAAHDFPNNDDVYLFDQWVHLAEGNDTADISQVAVALTNGSLVGMQSEVETINRRFGYVQLFESMRTYPLRGKKVSLTFSAAGTLDNVRAAVIEWTGTADSVTSDVVNAWNSAGSSPTLATSWAYCTNGNGTNNAMTTTQQEFSLENITVGSTANNLGVFIYLDDSNGALSETLILTTVQLTQNDAKMDYQTYNYNADLANCERYYSYLVDCNHQGDADGAASDTMGTISYPRKRTAPTITLFNSTNTNCGTVGTEDPEISNCTYGCQSSSGAGQVRTESDLSISSEL